MDADKYQDLAARTLIDRLGFEISDSDIMIIWNAIGLAGEAGEVADTVKKGIFHQHGLDRPKLIKELGDVMWYVAALCTKLDVDLSVVMAANISKLRARYPHGYNTEDSIARIDAKEPQYTTPSQAKPIEPLWSDERIRRKVWRMTHGHISTPTENVERFAVSMRDSYEAEVAVLTDRVQELEAQIARIHAAPSATEGAWDDD